MELHPDPECLAASVSLQCLCLILERWPKLESKKPSTCEKSCYPGARHNMECRLSSTAVCSSADFNSDLFCTQENANCNGYCQVSIGAWRAFLGIKEQG